MSAADQPTAGSSVETNLEQVKLELERHRIEEEIKLKREELQIRRGELSKSLWSSPLLLALLGLFATITVNIVQNFFQSNASRSLERQKFESSLIQKAVETADKDDAAKRLRFLLDLGLITDENGKIAGYVAHPDTIPLQPQDLYRGKERASAKLSVGSEP